MISSPHSLSSSSSSSIKHRWKRLLSRSKSLVHSTSSLESPTIPTTSTHQESFALPIDDRLILLQRERDYAYGLVREMQAEFAKQLAALEDEIKRLRQ